jgi:hypothetical protein
MPKCGFKPLIISICGGNMPMTMMNMIIIAHEYNIIDDDARQIDVRPIVELESRHVHLRIEQSS